MKAETVEQIFTCEYPLKVIIFGLGHIFTRFIQTRCAALLEIVLKINY